MAKFAKDCVFFHAFLFFCHFSTDSCISVNVNEFLYH